MKPSSASEIAFPQQLADQRECDNPAIESRRSRRLPRRGMFLIIALVVVTVCTMAAYSFTDLMIAYDESTILSGSRAQADQMVQSGIELVRMVLSQPADLRSEMGGVDNNPALFQAVNIQASPDAVRRGNVTIIAPAVDSTGNLSGVRYGLQNESARLNVNVLPIIEANYSVGDTALEAAAELGLADSDQLVVDDQVARGLLMALPNMTEDVADAILDWIDEDDEAREYGAEYDYYNALPNPYHPRNGAIDSVEELLLVRGVTPELLFGADHNRNGILDPVEQTMIVGASQSTQSFGWSAYMSVHSREGNKTAGGQARVNVNGEDLETLLDELTEVLESEDWATFVVAYRVSGTRGANSSPDSPIPSPASGDSVPWSADAIEKFDLSSPKVEISQLLDLVGATVTVNANNRSTTYTSPFSNDSIAMALYMPQLMGLLTSKDYASMPGRINLNECPAELIQGLPLLDDETKQALIDARAENSDSENRKFETWPLVEGILTLEQMRSLLPLVTTGGDVYRAQVIGYFEGANQSSRAEVIIDATTINPDIVYMRNLSHLGRGFDVGTLGIRVQEVP